MGSKPAELIRVLIADEHPVYRDGLAEAIKQSAGLKLVGKAKRGSDALEQIRSLRPDVAVLEIKLRGLDGVEVMKALRRDALPSRFLFLSASFESDTVYRAVEAGARGYISKDSAAGVICDAVLAVADGRMVLAPEAQEAVAEEIRLRTPAEPCPLSKRELEIVSLIADGHPVAEIAGLLTISPFTVRTHIRRAYRKLGVSGRAAAVAEAMRRGLFGVALIFASWSDASEILFSQ
jgi:two-component system, NarL family, nitrate/nitrite response regulator NarL